MFVCEVSSWLFYASPLSVSRSFTFLKRFLYTQSLVRVLYLILFYTQSAVRVPQSAVRRPLLILTVTPTLLEESKFHNTLVTRAWNNCGISSIKAQTTRTRHPVGTTQDMQFLGLAHRANILTHRWLLFLLNCHRVLALLLPTLTFQSRRMLVGHFYSLSCGSTALLTIATLAQASMCPTRLASQCTCMVFLI